MHFTTYFGAEKRRADIVAAARSGQRRAETAREYGVSRQMIARWLKRLTVQTASSRPRRQPRKSSPELEEQVRQLRETDRMGPWQIGQRLGIPASTAYKILVRLGINKLPPLEPLPPPGPRYEYAKPGGLVHMDVKKLHRLGLEHPSRGSGECEHVMLDDCSRFVFTERHPDETALTITAFFERGVARFASLGVTIERLLSDNHQSNRSVLLRNTCQLLGIRQMFTRPRRPQTNGKCERWNRTMMEAVFRGQRYRSQEARGVAVDKFTDYYNAHRQHTALGGKTPLQRLVEASKKCNPGV
jgi:transposase InsO family protein